LRIKKEKEIDKNLLLGIEKAQAKGLTLVEAILDVCHMIGLEIEEALDMLPDEIIEQCKEDFIKRKMIRVNSFDMVEKLKSLIK